jgi:hypothetical protein
MENSVESLRAALPNGFHDAYLLTLSLDLVTGEAVLAMRVSFGDPDASTKAAQNATRRGALRLHGLVSATLEPPDPKYLVATEKGAAVDGDFGSYPGDPEPPDDGLVRVWFFVSTWNSRMLFTARSCDLEWVP